MVRGRRGCWWEWYGFRVGEEGEGWLVRRGVVGRERMLRRFWMWEVGRFMCWVRGMSEMGL